MSHTTQSVVHTAFRAIKTVMLSPAISLEELRLMLMTELGNPSEDAIPTPSAGELHFENIFDFAAWYDKHQSSFTDAQRAALNTVAHTRAAVEVGCACKRANREAMAHQYFETFWSKNKNTDLLKTIADIGCAKKVSIGAFCSYPCVPEIPS